LYILPTRDEAAPAWDGLSLGDVPVDLGHGMGRLSLASNAPLGLSDVVIAQGLSLHSRKGGEEIKPVNQSYTKKLKKLLQEDAVVPWMREQLPLVYAGGQLVAVGDLWLASEAVSRPGTAIRWDDKPALH
jgi:tRNA(Ile)-lysidine synthase